MNVLNAVRALFGLMLIIVSDVHGIVKQGKRLDEIRSERIYEKQRAIEEARQKKVFKGSKALALVKQQNDFEDGQEPEEFDFERPVEAPQKNVVEFKEGNFKPSAIVALGVHDYNGSLRKAKDQVKQLIDNEFGQDAFEAFDDFHVTLLYMHKGLPEKIEVVDTVIADVIADFKNKYSVEMFVSTSDELDVFGAGFVAVRVNSDAHLKSFIRSIGSAFSGEHNKECLELHISLGKLKSKSKKKAARIKELLRKNQIHCGRSNHQVSMIELWAREAKRMDIRRFMVGSASGRLRPRVKIQKKEVSLDNVVKNEFLRLAQIRPEGKVAKKLSVIAASSSSATISSVKQQLLLFDNFDISSMPKIKSKRIVKQVAVSNVASRSYEVVEPVQQNIKPIVSFIKPNPKAKKAVVKQVALGNVASSSFKVVKPVQQNITAGAHGSRSNKRRRFPEKDYTSMDEFLFGKLNTKPMPGQKLNENRAKQKPVKKQIVVQPKLVVQQPFVKHKELSSPASSSFVDVQPIKQISTSSVTFNKSKSAVKQVASSSALSSSSAAAQQSKHEVKKKKVIPLNKKNNARGRLHNMCGSLHIDKPAYSEKMIEGKFVSILTVGCLGRKHEVAGEPSVTKKASQESAAKQMLLVLGSSCAK